MLRIIIALAICCILIQAQTSDDDKVTFPSWPTYKFQTYSGFLSVGSNKRKYHYVFLESQTAPATDPVVLWLNGGPGCSSLLGLLTEIGPFLLTKDANPKFTNDGFGWNKKANVIFLESPAGVGFSQNNDASYQYNDDNTAADNYEALKVWFSRFPTYKNRDFWITGESYGGMYIPYAAKAIVDGNDKTTDKINLKGILIGNGRITSNTDIINNAIVQYFKGRNFFDLQTSFILDHQCQLDPSSFSCSQAQRNYLQVLKDINPYNVYGYCASSDSTKEEFKSNQQQVRFPYTPWLILNEIPSASLLPCTDMGPMQNYLNDAGVQIALHVTGTWAGCSSTIMSAYKRNEKGSSWILPLLHDKGVKIVLYSGDMDGVVSVQETLDSLAEIKLTQTQGWTPIGDDEKLLSGWTITYDILDFIVVRAAGHMVPGDQRKVAFNMLNNYIHKSSLQFDLNEVFKTGRQIE